MFIIKPTDAPVSLLLNHLPLIAFIMNLEKMKSLNQYERLMCHLSQKSFISVAINGMRKLSGSFTPKIYPTPTAIKL